MPGLGCADDFAKDLNFFKKIISFSFLDQFPLYDINHLVYRVRLILLSIIIFLAIGLLRAGSDWRFLTKGGVIYP
jgi:hypothetical protein